MRYKKSFIQVIGTIWMPKTTAAMQIDLCSFDVKNMINEDGTASREDVEEWLSSHSGDFSNVIDFRADIELPNGQNIVFDWQDEESDIIYSDCMYHEEY